MSAENEGAAVPEWDTADKMRKALRYAGISVQEMAKYLGVSRNTVGSWINGRVSPSVAVLRAWAMCCGVSYAWLISQPRDPVTVGANRRNRPVTTPTDLYDRLWIPGQPIPAGLLLVTGSNWQRSSERASRSTDTKFGRMLGCSGLVAA